MKPFYLVNKEEETYIKVIAERVEDAKEIGSSHDYEYDLCVTKRPQGKNWVRLMVLESYYG